MEKNNASLDGDINAGNAEQRIAVVEEILNVETKEIEKGTIHLVKTVDETTVNVPLTTRKQGYHIERIPIGQYVDVPPPAIRYEGNVMIVSVVEEEAVIQKRLKIVEELRITSTEEQTVDEQQISLRKENVTVERRKIN